MGRAAERVADAVDHGVLEPGLEAGAEEGAVDVVVHVCGAVVRAEARGGDAVDDDEAAVHGDYAQDLHVALLLLDRGDRRDAS